ncbi:MAG TPA: hypothetical protein ENK52_05055, partial [Saprospiraceae bacterium]|nr:hypothetical protein [Saprospiraceae bacterium]
MDIFSQSVIKTALLGTKTKKLDLNIFPEVIRENLDQTKETELLLLDALAMTDAYFSAGQELTNIDGLNNTIPICPDEDLPYCDAQAVKLLKLIFKEKNYSIISFLPLLIEKVNTHNTIFPPEFIQYIHPFINSQNATLKHIRTETIQSFGKRGKWIFSLMKPIDNQSTTSENSFLDLSKSERKEYFKQVLAEEKRTEALEFLEEIFPAETTANQKGYLKIIGESITESDQDILDFIGNYLDQNKSKSKGYESLLSLYEMLQINIPSSKKFKAYYENIFSKIWKAKGFFSAFSGLKIKGKKELTVLFRPLESFNISYYYSDAKKLNGIDQQLFYVLATVPADLWCKQLKCSKKELVKSFHQIKRMEKSKFDKYSFTEALLANVNKFKDKELAVEIFKQFGMSGIGPHFLKMMSKEDAILFIEKYAKYFQNWDGNLIDFAVNEL